MKDKIKIVNDIFAKDLEDKKKMRPAEARFSTERKA